MRILPLILVTLLVAPAAAQQAEGDRGERMFEAAPSREEAERSPFIAPGFSPVRRADRRYDNIVGRSVSEGDRYDFEASGPPGLRKSGNRRLQSLFDATE